MCWGQPTWEGTPNHPSRVTLKSARLVARGAHRGRRRRVRVPMCFSVQRDLLLDWMPTADCDRLPTLTDRFLVRARTVASWRPACFPGRVSLTLGKLLTLARYPWDKPDRFTWISGKWVNQVSLAFTKNDAMRERWPIQRGRARYGNPVALSLSFGTAFGAHYSVPFERNDKSLQKNHLSSVNAGDCYAIKIKHIRAPIRTYSFICEVWSRSILSLT